MKVAVLVIIYGGAEQITVHENEDVAWSELVRFVEEHWVERFGLAEITMSLISDAAVERFFSREGDAYFVGMADLTDIAMRFDAVI
jgi:hypothetical protein